MPMIQKIMYNMKLAAKTIMCVCVCVIANNSNGGYPPLNYKLL